MSVIINPFSQVLNIVLSKIIRGVSSLNCDSYIILHLFSFSSKLKSELILSVVLKNLFSSLSNIVCIVFFINFSLFFKSTSFFGVFITFLSFSSINSSVKHEYVFIMTDKNFYLKNKGENAYNINIDDVDEIELRENNLYINDSIIYCDIIKNDYRDKFKETILIITYLVQNGKESSKDINDVIDQVLNI